MASRCGRAIRRARAIAQPPVRTGSVGKGKGVGTAKAVPYGRGVRLRPCDGRGLRTQAKNVEVDAEVARDSASFAGVIVQEVFRQISDVRRRL